MAKKSKITQTVATERILNVRNDPPDIRDRIYEPALIRLRSELIHQYPELVLDQGTEGTCTGFGLAAVINLLKYRGGIADFRGSPRMLYEMAKMHDEWPGEDYSGSSCRGAIRGWHNMGVCTEKSWPYGPHKQGAGLTVERAREARHNTLGAYYRLRSEIVDYHAALNETGALFVSAKVHEGWSNVTTNGSGRLPKIRFSRNYTGGHAFAIVGYNREGFVVQNSWGQSWGDDGFAIWRYEDWIENVMDGWVFRLALPTPQIFGLEARAGRTARDVKEQKAPPTKRFRIAGHFVHFDDGQYKKKGNYWSTSEDVRQTAARLAGTPNSKYGHLMIYAHGGLNAPPASARRIAALKNGFKRNGIYPFHIMYDTGLAETIKDVIRRALGLAEERAAGFLDFTDGLIEDFVRKPVTPIWDEMKRDAELPFEPADGATDGDGTDAFKFFVEALAGKGKSIHLVGHSTGGVLLGHLLDALDTLDAVAIESCSLMAPACTMEFFETHYLPRLGTGGGKTVRLPKLTIYNLNDKMEKDDQVATACRKSLLYLVSRALERKPKVPLLGMQIYSQILAGAPGLEIIYADDEQERTTSRTHGGFDNDANTMNNILRTILGAEPKEPFKPKEMEGY